MLLGRGSLLARDHAQGRLSGGLFARVEPFIGVEQRTVCPAGAAVFGQPDDDPADQIFLRIAFDAVMGKVLQQRSPFHIG